MDREGKVQTSKKMGVLSALGEDKSLHYPQSIAYGTHRKVTGLS